MMVNVDRSIAVQVIANGEEENPKTKHVEGSWRRYSFGTKRKENVARRDVPKKDVLRIWLEEDTVKRCT